MNAILALLAKLNPGIQKNKLYKIAEYLVLAGLLYSLYADATGSLSTAKANRDEQIKGILVQSGVNHTLIYEMKEDIDQLRSWNKALSARINRLEDAAIRRGH